MKVEGEARAKLASLIGELALSANEVVSHMGNLIRELEPPAFAGDQSRWAQLARMAPAEEQNVPKLYERLKNATISRQLQGEEVLFLMARLERAINANAGAFRIRNLAIHGLWVQMTIDDIQAYRASGTPLEGGPEFFQIFDLRMMNDLGRRPEKVDRSGHIGVTTDGSLLRNASVELQEIKALMKGVTSLVVAENNERHMPV
ncbi:MAG: hypothetical protein AAF543_06285 [Pseudomonadota bacterium]